jgi:VanZ family protein
MEIVLKNGIIRWAPLVVWVAVIFGMSSIPRLKPPDIDLPVGLDKIAHLLEYSVFALLFYRGLTYPGRRPRWHLLLIVLFTGAAIAAMDEMYQSYIPGRDSSALDLLADVTGIVAGTLAAFLVHLARSAKGDA